MSEFRHPRSVLADLGIRPSKRLSQNFLTQPRVAERIASLAWWPPDTPALEIGGGTGVLTDAILTRYRNVTVVEFDRTLAPYLRKRYAGAGREHASGGSVRVLEADARDVDLTAVAPGRSLGVFGNLPYSITTDLLMMLIRARHALAGAVVMVQREYAERLVATPKTKAYGSLSVFAALNLRVRERFRVGPRNFFPPPDVASTVLALEFVAPPPGVDMEWVERVVRAAFAYRRKMMKANVTQALQLDPARVVEALREVVGSDTVRAEELSEADFLAVASRLHADAG